jgi:hypothetical protein
MGGEMMSEEENSPVLQVLSYFENKSHQELLAKVAALRASIAKVRELQGYTMEGCYLVKSESIWKSAWNGDYVATADLEELLFGPTIRDLGEVGG